MHDAQGRYLALLLSEGAAAARAVLDKERYEPMVLASRREYDAEIVAAGLHPEGAPLPAAFPVTQTYSRSVAGLLRVLGSFCADCVEFNAHAQQRDLDEEVRLVVRQSHALAEKVVAEALLPVVEGRRLKPDQAMQLVANALALADAVPALYGRRAMRFGRGPFSSPGPQRDAHSSASVSPSSARRRNAGSGRCASSRPSTWSAWRSSSPRPLRPREACPCCGTASTRSSSARRRP